MSPAFSSAPKKAWGKAHARPSGGPNAKDAAKSLFPNPVVVGGFVEDDEESASWKKSTNETEAPVMEDPTAQAENSSTKS
jgi:hypothetical protein|mmetsp:Transcript_24636/g.44582  ORF Transcript_24636/g.44582 Transcript_24636/m.44582 type:complete len:80 (+) Transcript_24636:323-562(+)